MGSFFWRADDTLSIVVKSDLLEELNLQKCCKDAFETHLDNKDYEKYITLIKSSKTLFDELTNRNVVLKNYLQ